MLKGIDPLLSPELLHTLAAMGHGDEIVLVDCHFPAVSIAQRLVRLDGVTLPQAARAVLSLLPIDTFIDQPVAGMRMVDTPDVVPDVQVEVFDAVREIELRSGIKPGGPKRCQQGHVLRRLSAITSCDVDDSFGFYVAPRGAKGDH